VSAAGGSLTQSGAGGGAASLTNTQLSLTFTSVSSNGGANGILFTGGSGSFTSGTTNLQNNGGIGLSMSGSAVVAGFGNTTVNSSAGDAVDLANNSGNITFADLDMTPDSGLRGLDATSNTGTLTVTSGDITTSGGATASAVFIDGPAGRTPINITFTTVTASGVGNTTNTGSITLVDVSGTKFQVTGTTQINTRAGHGVFVDNSTATNIQFATVNVPNPNAAGGDGIHVEDSSSAVTVATTTITDANRITAQNDANTDFIPDNDGDGNAIFLRGNAGGSFTLNGGSLTNCGNDCIDTRDSQNLAISGVTIDSPGIDETGATGGGFGGHGVQAINLTGTNTITNSTITDWETQNRDGLRYINHSSTASTLTIHGTTFSDSANGSNAIFVSGRDAANMTLNVGGTSAGQPCTFSEIFGAALTHNAGDNTNSTATVNLNVRNNTFTNVTTKGQNSVSARNLAGGKAIVVITGNTFDGVGRTQADTSGVIDLGGDALLAGNFVHFTVTNNIIRNIGDNIAGSCGGLECHGKRGIDVFIDDNTLVGNDATTAIDADDAIVIDGNVITNVQRTGIIFDVGGTSNPSNFAAKITNNRVGIRADNTIDRVGVGDALSPGGESAIRVENRNPNGKNLNILISNNLFYNGNGGAGSLLNGSGMLIRAQETATMSATVTNNTFNVNNSSTAAGINAQTTNGTTCTFCMDASGNTITAPGGGFSLAEVNGTLNIEQASSAALSAANGGASVSIATGTPQFGIACATPPAAPSLDEDQQPEPQPGPVGGGDGEGEPTGEPVGDVISSLHTDAAPSAAEVVKAGFSQERRADAKPLSKQFERTVSYGEGTQSAPLGATASLGLNEADKQAEPEMKVAAKSRAVTAAAFDHNGTVHINIGTLPAGDSVTITFQVTVNDPIPAGTTQVCNQGQVSGTNFSTVNTDDPGTGTAGDATCTPVQPPVDVTIGDATASEPPVSGAQNFATFPVRLSQASGSTVTVSYATANGGANPATGGADCTTPGNDYKTTSGTLTFNPGQTVQTISVEICFDGATESPDETFLVNLTGATNANVTQPPADNQAVGTITDQNPAGEVLISELRTSGPGGTADDFVELYNNSDTPLTVNSTDATAGWSIVKSGATCTDTPVVVGTVPNGTVIPARGHYLLVGSAYSLGSYPAGSGTTATGDVTLTADIENDRNVGLFKTTNVANLSSATKVDAVGFGANTGNNCDLLRESTTLANASGSTSEYSFVRLMPMPAGKPQDTNVNASDFRVVSTTPATPVGDNAAPT
ncbi:MAG TPA: Calx-beta domain-containing protein, partial [Pyrinomonadaceae bacterium]|nr:Calx-beta domain-containing protein [Pyrinomonadaceae bacterium]